MQGVSAKNMRATICTMREGRFYKFWVYIMTRRTGTLYVGMTSFVDTRVNPRWQDLAENWGRGCCSAASR
jgi:hypothetical protein